ncbi:molybdopterin-guanine dinucleotide biosynthesis protein MobA [Yersinia intermedia]|nr:molybdopterin-guanine dinucleotide biosynthesis protein MobA [Yersinia intermedia]
MLIATKLSTKKSGIPVINDIITGFCEGPLAGMHAGLSHSATEWVVFAPCDVPMLPLKSGFPALAIKRAGSCSLCQ